MVLKNLAFFDKAPAENSNQIIFVDFIQAVSALRALRALRALGPEGP